MEENTPMTRFTQLLADFKAVDGRTRDTGRGRGSNRRGWSGLEFG